MTNTSIHRLAEDKLSDFVRKFKITELYAAQIKDTLTFWFKDVSNRKEAIEFILTALRDTELDVTVCKFDSIKELPFDALLCYSGGQWFL